MAPQPTAKKRTAPRIGSIARYGLLATVISISLAGAIYGSQQFQQFLIRDTRFFLPGPADYGLESPNLELTGIKYASRAQVLRVFDQDYGRSLYLFPLVERRRALRNVRWVHDATVVRIWPNRLSVQIVERKPAAFVKLPADNIARWALIDDEGVILEPPAKAAFQLPVLAGIHQSEALEKRGTRVRRMLRLTKELGRLADKVSEIDVSDLDNLKITEQVAGNGVSLILGDRNFTSRLQNFLDHYPDIHAKMPQASTFDLRLDDRITGLEGNGDAR
jgi:cell division protein FtsQ